MRFTMSDWPVPPMEPVTRAEAFDSADTLFQVKWDGVRVLAYAYPQGGIRLFNRRLHERTAQYPELVAALDGLAKGTVLDGEVVALDAGGKPDFPRVLRRDLVRSPLRITALVTSVPVHYMAFDVLWLDGEALCPLPLSERLEKLTGLSLRDEMLNKVESVPATGKALFGAVNAEGLEGIVAKKADSPYFIGRKTDAWQKIKCFRRLTCTVGGYLMAEADPARIRSMLVGLPGPDGLRYIGAVASGVTQAQWRTLYELFKEISGPCPFEDPPALPGARWMRPILKVQVRFLEYTAEGVMRAPSVTGFPEGNA